MTNFSKTHSVMRQGASIKDLMFVNIKRTFYPNEEHFFKEKYITFEKTPL